VTLSGWKYMDINFDMKFGLIESIQYRDVEVIIEQKFMYYTTTASKSAYYLFDPMRNPNEYLNLKT
jgi:extradiol dioxygenase family protein